VRSAPRSPISPAGASQSRPSRTSWDSPALTTQAPASDRPLPRWRLLQQTKKQLHVLLILIHVEDGLLNDRFRVFHDPIG
jgi:hypothetical protein